jgi:phage terminase Nu1 subunit (DNA packaging protein)
MGTQVTASVLANMLGVSKKAISDLAKRGIVAPAGRGRYALEASVNSYCAYLRLMAASRGGQDAAEARARLGQAQATLAATKAKR